MLGKTQIILDAEIRRRAQAKAAELKISFAEYVRRLIAGDLAANDSKADVSTIFDLADFGSETDIARNKDEMIAEAILDEKLLAHYRGD
jgi:hypothetical protein